MFIQSFADCRADQDLDQDSDLSRQRLQYVVHLLLQQSDIFGET